MSGIKGFIGSIHHHYVFMRRIEALTRAIIPLLESGTVLDLGTGNGMIGQKLMALRPDIDLIGVDVLVRPGTLIPVIPYDGVHLPFADDAFSSLILVDVLHHTPDFRVILEECRRVSRTIIIKDHFYRTSIEHRILRGLDWVGNAPHGVELPYNYFTRDEWASALHSLALNETFRQESVTGMYPQPFQSVIGRNIQFIAKLVRL